LRRETVGRYSQWLAQVVVAQVDLRTLKLQMQQAVALVV
jgi:hypothetical protein